MYVIKFDMIWYIAYAIFMVPSPKIAKYAAYIVPTVKIQIHYIVPTNRGSK